jgi:protein-disulfide isomerase
MRSSKGPVIHTTLRATLSQANARVLLSAAVGFLSVGIVFATPRLAGATEMPQAQKAQIESVVHDYLIANPEVIRDAIDELERRQKVAEAETARRVVTQSSDKLFNSKHQAVVGNPAGDVTLVEFFDYNCGYCKQSLTSVSKLIESDPNLRVVLKDFPILGTNSTEAAQVAAAVREQLKGEKFWEFHRRLLSVRGSIGKTQAMNVARELGVDMDRLEKDLKGPEVHAALEEVAALADDLHFSGTPSWVLGKETMVGGVPMAQLKAKIDNVRKCGKTMC